jgi:type IX secretion system PorP/SprF family membrane protein
VKFILPFIAGCFFSLTVRSQDIHFSQFMNCPMNINPAFTGSFEGDWRFIGNFRDQWRSIGYPFRTISASYDRQVYIQKHHLSLGGFLVNDRSGYVGLNSNMLFASGAYHRVINNHQVSGGIQIGYVMQSIGDGELTLPSGWNRPGGLDEDFSPAEGMDDKLSYLDFNIGLGWKKKIRSLEPQLGLALFHANMPKKSFLGKDIQLGMRKVFYAGVKTKLSQSFYFKPEFTMSSLSGANNIIVGTEAGYAMSGSALSIREIRAGIYARNTFTKTVDAMVITLGAQVRKLYFQISYDYNVSSLNKITNSRGAFELTFIYKSISTIIKTFTIPCERI